MQRKQVIFVADSLDNAHKFQQVLSSLDVDVAAGSSAQFKKLLGRHPACDLVVYEARGGASEDVAGIEALLLEDGTASLLVIVGEGQLARFRLPVQVKSDFVMRNASPEECAARIRQLLWPGNEAATSDCLVVENMTVNLATYQVTVAGEPLDLTYCWPSSSRTPRARTRETRCCAACGASTTTAARERWTSTSAASARSWAPNWPSTWKPSAASATSGAHRSSSPPPAQTSQQEPPPPR